MKKQRKGQEYLRRMILTFYGGKCALTGINVEQLINELYEYKVKYEKLKFGGNGSCVQLIGKTMNL